MHLQYFLETHLFVERVEEDSSLNRLSETHFICQDGVCSLSPRKTQPVQSLKLVRVKRAASRVQIIRLPIKLYSGLKVIDRKKNIVSQKRMNAFPLKLYQSYCTVVVLLIIILMFTLERIGNYRTKVGNKTENRSGPGSNP